MTTEIVIVVMLLVGCIMINYDYLELHRLWRNWQDNRSSREKNILRKVNNFQEDFNNNVIVLHLTFTNIVLIQPPPSSLIQGFFLARQKGIEKSREIEIGEGVSFNWKPNFRGFMVSLLDRIALYSLSFEVVFYVLWYVKRIGWNRTELNRILFVFWFSTIVMYVVFLSDLSW